MAMQSSSVLVALGCAALVIVSSFLPSFVVYLALFAGAAIAGLLHLAETSPAPTEPVPESISPAQFSSVSAKILPEQLSTLPVKTPEPHEPAALNIPEPDQVETPELSAVDTPESPRFVREESGGFVMVDKTPSLEELSKAESEAEEEEDYPPQPRRFSVPPASNRPSPDLAGLSTKQITALEGMREIFKTETYPDQADPTYWFQLDDGLFLKFLQARDFNLKKAETMLKDTLAFRRKHVPHTISIDEPALQALLRFKVSQKYILWS
jgi:hypothetical protein